MKQIHLYLGVDTYVISKQCCMPLSVAFECIGEFMEENGFEPRDLLYFVYDGSLSEDNIKSMLGDLLEECDWLKGAITNCHVEEVDNVITLDREDLKNM